MSNLHTVNMEERPEINKRPKVFEFILHEKLCWPLGGSECQIRKPDFWLSRINVCDELCSRKRSREAGGLRWSSEIGEEA